MRRALRVSAAATIAGAVSLFSSPDARATSALEFPDNGSEQEGRGGASRFSISSLTDDAKNHEGEPP